MTRKPVLFRADASASIGTGHVTRCRVLALALAREGVPAVWLCRSLPPALEALLTADGFIVHRTDAPAGPAEADAIRAQAAAVGAQLVVIDHYGVDARTEGQVRRGGFPVLAVDDMYLPHDCDLVLNQNLYADKTAYRGQVPEECRILAGWRYALLRDEFVEVPRRPRGRPSRDGTRVLVCLGGGDHPNISLRVLRALERVAGVTIQVELIIGGSNPHVAALRTAAAESPLDITLDQDVRDMARRMARADLAVTAGGTTHLELVATALPALMVTIADNQERVTAHMGSEGLAISLGWHEDVTEASIAAAVEALLTHPTQYEEMVTRLGELGPPVGARRVAGAILAAELRSFTLSPMGPDDLMDAYQLSNDPSVRGRSFGTAPIPLDEHQRWFTGRLSDSEGFFFSVRHPARGFIGQLRLDRAAPLQRRWTVSLALTPAAQGKGLGQLVLRRAIHEALRGTGPFVVDAWVRTDNPASLSSFLDAGFDDGGVETVKGAQAHRLSLRGE